MFWHKITTGSGRAALIAVMILCGAAALLSSGVWIRAGGHEIDVEMREKYRKCICGSMADAIFSRGQILSRDSLPSAVRLCRPAYTGYI